MFGNPEVGRPMAALHIKAPPMIRRLGCGLFMLAPTCWIKGRMMSAATVWLMKVATTRISAANTTMMPYRLKSCTCAVM